MALLIRQFVGNNNQECVDSFGNTVNCHSSWSTWGRWVALGALLVFGFLFFFLCSCLTARRRRRAGRQPFYGTGWAAHGQPTYHPNAESQQPVYRPYNENSPPAYGGQDQGYYGGQQTGTEMMPPQSAYHGDTNGYQPPVGPPPKKGRII